MNPSLKFYLSSLIILIADLLGLNQYCVSLIFFANCHRLIPLYIVSLLVFILLLIGSRKVLFSQRTLVVKFCIIIMISVLALSPYIYKYSVKFYADKIDQDFNNNLQSQNFIQKPVIKNNKIEQVKFSFLIINKSKRGDITIVFGPKGLSNPRAVTQMVCAGKASFNNGEDAVISLEAKNLTSISCEGNYIFYDFSMEKNARGNKIRLLPFLRIESQISFFGENTYWFQEFNGNYSGVSTSKNLINTEEVEFFNIYIYSDWNLAVNNLKLQSEK